MPKKLRFDNLPRTLTSAEVVFDQETEASMGYGLAEMDEPEAGEEAIRALNGSDLQGSRIAVYEASD
jgi:RNA recognition motif-containing protein